MNFEGYKGHFIPEGIDNQSAVYKQFKMVPPGPLYYFYSIGNLDKMKKEDLKQLKTLTDGYNPIKFNEDPII